MEIYSNSKIKVPTFNEASGFYTTDSRSKLMSKIKSKNTKPEIVFRKILWSHGIRYRKNATSIPGSPDILISKSKLVIFIDGEFWHGYNWLQKKEKLVANREYWIAKIERNMQRDRENDAQLGSLGYTVLRFWEKDVKKDLDGCLKRVLTVLKARC